MQVLALGRVLPCDVGEYRSAEIGDVFAFRELRVDVNVIDHDVLRVLIDHAIGALGELLGVLLGPPVFQIALGVVLAAFIVEAVRQLMSDGRAGIAVVGRGIHLGIVERRHAARRPGS